MQHILNPHGYTGGIWGSVTYSGTLQMDAVVEEQTSDLRVISILLQILSQYKHRDIFGGEHSGWV